MSGVLGALLATARAAGAINLTLANGANTDAQATWSLESDGDHAINGGDVADWVTPKAAASLYEVKVDPTIGSFTGGTTGTWLPMTSTRTWTRDPPGAPGSTTVTFTVSWREAGTLIDRGSQAGITLQGIKT